VVIRIGRILTLPARINASRVLCPSAFIWLVKSTSRIAFFPTSPTNMIMPRIEKIVSDCMVSHSTSRAPMIARGIEKSTTNGSM